MAFDMETQFREGQGCLGPDPPQGFDGLRHNGVQAPIGIEPELL